MNIEKSNYSFYIVERIDTYIRSLLKVLAMYTAGYIMFIRAFTQFLEVDHYKHT